MRLMEASSVHSRPHNVSGASWSWACGGRGVLLSEMFLLSSLAVVLRSHPGALEASTERLTALVGINDSPLQRGFPSVCLRDVPHTGVKQPICKGRAIRGLISKSVFRG